MLNRSASLAMSTSVLKALPGKLDIKRQSPSILYIYNSKYEDILKILLLYLTRGPKGVVVVAELSPRYLSGYETG